MKQSKVIGITGGIGSGKSTVAAYISEKYQTGMILADQVGRELMEPGQSVYMALVEHYGEHILNADGSINRSYLAGIALKDEESQKEINAVEHPLIKEEIVKRIEEDPHEIVLLEAALLIEGGLVPVCTEVWYIRTRRDIRIRRLREGRGYTYKKCRIFMKQQFSDREFMKYADRIVPNNDDFSETEKAIACHMESLEQVKSKEEA